MKGSFESLFKASAVPYICLMFTVLILPLSLLIKNEINAVILAGSFMWAHPTWQNQVPCI